MMSANKLVRSGYMFLNFLGDDGIIENRQLVAQMECSTPLPPFFHNVCSHSKMKLVWFSHTLLEPVVFLQLFLLYLCFFQVCISCSCMNGYIDPYLGIWGLYFSHVVSYILIHI